MRNLALAIIAVIALSWSAGSVSALPASPVSVVQVHLDIVELKGGRGIGKGHSFKPRGWSKGRKVGWRGRGCPPGLWKQGRC